MLAGVVQQLSTVLKGRLTLKNAHKQWLALELVQEVSAVHLKVVSRCSGGDFGCVCQSQLLKLLYKIMCNCKGNNETRQAQRCIAHVSVCVYNHHQPACRDA